MDSDAAAAVAAQHTATFNLATSIPQLITVSFFAVLADYRGRQLTLLLCFAGGFLQFLIVWLVPAGRFCLLGMCTEDSFYFIVGASSAVSFLGASASEKTKPPSSDGLFSTLNTSGEASFPQQIH